MAAAAVLVRAQIIADKPSAVQNPEPQPASSSSISPSSCPFLNALDPPVVKVPWHKRFMQLFKPYEFQTMLLQDAVHAGSTMVAVDKTVG